MAFAPKKAEIVRCSNPNSGAWPGVPYDAGKVFSGQDRLSAQIEKLNFFTKTEPEPSDGRQKQGADEPGPHGQEVAQGSVRKGPTHEPPEEATYQKSSDAPTISKKKLF